MDGRPMNPMSCVFMSRDSDGKDHSLQSLSETKTGQIPKHLTRFFDVMLARLAGFEPTTPWFVAKYSIQLSYSRSLKPEVYTAFQGLSNRSARISRAWGPPVAPHVNDEKCLRRHASAASAPTCPS